MVSWTVLQLADSAFPTGGFVHSGGLEAMIHAGLVPDRAALRQFCEETIGAAVASALPFVGAGWDAPDPAALAVIDATASQTLWSHVAARASRAQGWALLDTAARAFETPALVALRAARGAHHLAPMFGFVTRALDVSRDEALATALHLTVRGVLSAAVRLGVVGPSEAQGLHHALGGALEAGLARARTQGPSDVAQTAPLLELVQATQDELYSRLFQS